MVKVENKGTLWLITKKFLKINRARNAIAILAIILTSLLFTTLFTGTCSMFLTQLETDKKKYITDSHAIIQQLSEEEGQRAETALKDASFVDKYGKDLFLGISEDARFPYLVEFHAGDDNSARNISVKNDIRTYGLLKNIGTTGKQLKKIVRMQAFILSITGIPVGLVTGYAAGVLLVPVLIASLNEKTETVTTAHPLIFLFSAIFSLLTVYLSILQACRIVAKVSPVEALRLAENTQTQKKSKKNFSVSCMGMALQNMRSSWKKGIIVMLSIAISLTILNITGILISLQDFEDIQDLYLAADFQLDKITSTLDFADLNAISPDIHQALDTCPCAEATGYTYYSREQLSMPEQLRETYEGITNKYLDQWGYDWNDTWQEIRTSNQIPVLYMGISKAIFDKFKWRGEPASWEDFQSGQYVITNYPDTYYTKETDYFYKKGDSLTMTYQSGENKTYEVLQEATLPTLLGYPYTDLISVEVYVPASEYIACTGNNYAMRAAINAIPGQEKNVQQYIENVILPEDNAFQFTSVLDLKKDFDRYVSKYYIIGGLLALVLAFIGIMNFYNTTATSLISRKKELALLEAVGMTKRQLLGMLILEGIFYLGGAVITAGFLTLLYSRRFTDRSISFYAFLPFLLMIPVLLFTAWAIPESQFRKMHRESVVERIRQ